MPKDATLETVALLSECGLYTDVSIPAFSITVFTHLAIVALEALLYGFMLIRNNLGDFQISNKCGYWTQPLIMRVLNKFNSLLCFARA